MISALLKFLGLSKERPSYKATFTSFPELNLDKVSEDFKLIEEGRLRGKQNLPTSDNDYPDQIELSIISLIEGEMKESKEKFERHLESQRSELEGQKIDSRIAELESIPDTVASEFNQSTIIGKDVLSKLKEEHVQSKRSMDEFKIKNSLSRSAQYPSSVILYYGVLLIFVAIETVLNGTFLARGHTSGLVGGASEAFVISFINIIAGYLIGTQVFTYKNHISKSWRIFSYGGILAYISAIFFFNLLVAHYRDVLGTELIENASIEAFRKFKLDPFGFNDIKSAWLFFLGLMFSVIALLDSYKMNDKYPGYGKLDRNLKQLHEDYLEQKADLINILEVIKEKAIKRIEQLVSELEFSVLTYENVTARRASITNQFNTHLDYLENCCNTLLDSYRVANRDEREEDPPEYFSNSWSYKDKPDAGTIAEIEIYSLDTSKKSRIKEMIEKSKQHKRKVLRDFNASMAKYESLEELQG